MKPINVQQFVPDFYVLRDRHGDFYIYSAPDIGVRHSDDMKLARKYSTLRGAKVAQAKLKRTYGYSTDPIYYHATITYHETTHLPN